MCNPHLGLINAPPLICFPPQNDLFHYSLTIKKARNRPNVDQILFTIHLLSKRPGRGAWDFINGGGLLICGGDYYNNIDIDLDKYNIDIVH